MAGGEYGVVLQDMHRLFERGTLSGLGEAQLLERYIRAHDETAFAALVHRHGPMVLRVCRRHLRDPRDVEDAFQATFLILVRKARGIRQSELLDHWLYGVAYRVAVRARATAARRLAHEKQGVVVDVEGPTSLRPDPELARIVDEEVYRLPARFRVPIVLCYLEGHTHEEAARRLQWPVGTVRSRLARGRQRLRGRLIGRGVAPAATAIVLETGSVEGSATVSSLLADSTVKAALGFSVGQSAGAGAVPASVAVLLEGVIRTMLIARCRMAAMALFLLVPIAVAGGVLASRSLVAADGPHRSADRPDRRPTVRHASAVAVDKDDDLARFQGSWRLVEEHLYKSSDWKPSRSLEWQFRGKSLRMVVDGKLDKIREGWEFELDRSNTPPRIALKHRSRAWGDKVLRAIYQFDEDRLRIAFGLTDRPAPESFQANSAVQLLIFQRIAPHAGTDSEEVGNADPVQGGRGGKAGAERVSESGPLDSVRKEPETATRLKVVARELLREARQSLTSGKLDDAESLVAGVEAMDVPWGVFDDTPAKVRDAIETARLDALAASPVTRVSTPSSNSVPAIDPFSSPSRRPSVEELISQLNMAFVVATDRQASFAAGRMSREGYLQAAGEYDLLVSRFRALEVELKEMRELLEIERDRKRSEVQEQQIRLDLMTKRPDSARRDGPFEVDVNRGKPGIQKARLEAKRAELRAVEARLLHAQRRLDQMDRTRIKTLDALSPDPLPAPTGPRREED